MFVKRKKSLKRDGRLRGLAAIGRRIRETRGFDRTQEEFANRLRISQGQLSKYERGLVLPSCEVLIRLKEEFGVDIDWLLTGQR